MRDAIDVLVADESESVRVLLASVLRGDQRFGSIVTVASGREVLAACDDADLVLLDLVFADMDAFAVMDAIRARRPGLTVVVYTAVGPPYLRAAAEARGAADYFTHSDDSDAVLDGLVAAVSKDATR